MKGNSLNVLMLGGARRVSLSELLRQSGARLGQEIKLFSYELFKEVPVAAEIGRASCRERVSSPV